MAGAAHVTGVPAGVTSAAGFPIRASLTLPVAVRHIFRTKQEISHGWRVCGPLCSKRSARRPRSSLAAVCLVILGVKSGAPVSDIRRAYRDKAKLCHPDAAESNGIDPEDAAVHFVRLTQAYNEAIRDAKSAERLPHVAMFSWELSVQDLQEFPVETLQSILTNSLGWGLSRRSPARESMQDMPAHTDRQAVVDALLPITDEMVRREVLINRANEAGDLEQAEALISARSLRHMVRDAWAQAISMHGKGSWQAVSLADRFHTLTEARADITSDEGDYPVDWDRDEAEVAAVRKSRAVSNPVESGAVSWPHTRENDQVRHTSDTVCDQSSLCITPAEGAETDNVGADAETGRLLTGFFRLAARTFPGKIRDSRNRRRKQAP